MKVVITDYTFPDLEIERSILEPLNCEIVSGQCKTPEELIELTADADYVITQFAPVSSDVISAMQKARVIVRYGIGFDNVDCEAAAKKNIPVCNIPEFCIDEVADHTLAFMLSATRNLLANCNYMRSGKWGLGVSLDEMRCLRDLSVGIIGFGRIGRAVAERLVPFKCKVLACDPVVSPEEVKALGFTYVGLDECLAECDIVTLHCPSTPQTRNIINSESLNKMKAGSILINIGRGDLVDLSALHDALSRGHISAAALDVFDPEPLPADHRLLGMDNVMVSSHIASASPKAARTLRESAANLVAMAIRGEPLPSVVNGVTM